MNIKKAIVAGLLVICGALVFFAISGDGVARADYNDGASELAAANDAEEILTELEYVLGMLEEIESSDKQIDLEPILFTFNICLIMGYVKQLAEMVGEDADLAGRVGNILLDFFQRAEESSQPEAFACSGEKWNDWIYPSWHHNFAAGNTASYIRVKYHSNNQSRLVNGRIKFYADIDGDGDDEEAVFPILWIVRQDDPNTPRVDESVQTFYFSCPFRRTKLIPIPEPFPLDLHLYPFAVHWRDDSQAVDTLDTFRFCEEWYCPVQSDPDLCERWCRSYFRMPETNPDQVWGWSPWGSSPLVGFIPFRSRWGAQGSPDYFDDIELAVNSGQIVLEEIEVVLNDINILDVSGVSLVVDQDASLKLWPLIGATRLSMVGFHDPSIIPALAHDIGQTVFYKYGGRWLRQHEAYEPLPEGAWCSEYACNMIEYYSDLSYWAGSGGCNDITVHTMWHYYGETNSNPPDPCWDRISAAEDPEQPEPDWCLDSWNELGDKVHRGYYVGLREPFDPEAIHSTFFIEWVGPMPGEVGAECVASFKAIGGNQGGVRPGRVTVTGIGPSPNHVTICNGTRPGCGCGAGDYTWSTNADRTTFFGKTWHPSKDENDGE